MQFAMSRKVLVTGANGFLGSHVVAHCLRAGWHVRALVRPPHTIERVAHLQQLAGATERLSLVPGDVFDRQGLGTALQGCTAVVHAAAAVTLSAKNPQKDIVDVAVQGTRNIMEVGRDRGVQRFVLTSSESAMIRYDRPEDHVFGEDDWCDDANLDNNPYGVAKRESERVLWTAAERFSDVEAVAINPGLVVGPVMCAAHLGSSMSILFDVVSRSHPGFAPMWHNVVDVAAVAQAHVQALDSTEAVGHRVPIAQEGMWWRDIAARLSSRYAVQRRELPLWIVRIATWFDPRVNWAVLRPLLGRPYHLDSRRAFEMFDLPTRPIDEALVEAADALVNGGYAPRAKKRS